MKNELFNLVERKKSLVKEMEAYENSLKGREVKVAFYNEIGTAEVFSVNYERGTVSVLILDVIDIESYYPKVDGFPLVEYKIEEIIE